MKKWILLITLNYSLVLWGQQGGAKSFQTSLPIRTGLRIQYGKLITKPAEILILKLALPTENFRIKYPFKQAKAVKPIIFLKEKREPVSTLGNQINFFNTVMLEHIITGESDITFFEMNFKSLGLSIEVFENKITSTSLIIETEKLLLPAITFTYEPGVPALLMAGFILDF